MDSLKRAISDKYGMSLIFIDVSKTASLLEQRHLNGPATAEILGQSVVSAALISSGLKGRGERITFQLKVDGPINGIIVEAGYEGYVRGYTDVKLLDNVDGKADIKESEILGNTGTLNVIRSDERGIIYSGQVNISPPNIRTVTARYLNRSEQVPTGVEIFSKMQDFRIEKMRGLMVRKLPDADTEKFVHVLEEFEKGRVKELLGGAEEIAAFAELFKMEDLEILEEKEMTFRCRCNYKKSLTIINSLEAVELEEMIKKKEPQQVTCHFCGETYNIKWEDLQSVLLDKADTSRPI
ncbi:MAG: Hsp33 family molecular chaperone HslO [Deltaproteobacteria bacterium]|nr:Hsp33 family molecular chaperone HslO [Deltaproteobacteria bacterium]